MNDLNPKRALDADNDGHGDYAAKVEDVSADARQRAGRTFVQNLAVAVLIAVLMVLVQTVGAAKTWEDIDWGTVALLAVQAILSAVASYAARFVVPPDTHA